MALQSSDVRPARGRNVRQNYGPSKCKGDRFPPRHDNIAIKPVKDDGIGAGQIVRRKRDGGLEYLLDDLTVEEPLEIRIGRKTLATTMRTPGHDEELAAGFLVSEGIARKAEQIAKISRPAVSAKREK